MTALLDRPAETAPRPARPLILAGMAAAVWAALLGLLTLAVLVLVGWATAADSGSSASEAVRTAGQGWLLAHHVRLGIPGGAFDLTPLGLLLIPGGLLYAAARRTARSQPIGSLRDAARVTAALAGTYALLCLLAAILVTTPDVRPRPWSALLSGLILSLIAGGTGILRGNDQWRAAKDLLPVRVRVLLAGAAAAVAALVGAGALLFCAATAAHVQRAGDLSRAFDTGPVGGFLFFLLGVALVPNLAIWGAAFAVGPGFAVGIGTSVSPAGVKLGVVPSLPVLAGLPPSGPAPVISLVAVLAPLIAGLLAGAVMVRRHAFETPERAALWAGGAGAAAGAAMAALCLLAGGPVGGGRLAAVGPSAWQVGVFTAVEVGIFGAAAAWWLQRRRDARRLRPPFG